MDGSTLPLPRSVPAAGAALRLSSDERLLRLAAGGSAAAFGVLYKRHHQDLYRYARTLVRDEQDAQDAVQSAMTRALAALQRGVPAAPARPWLFRITHNEAVSALRRRRPAEELDGDRGPAGPPLEATVEERGRLATLVADLQDLPERQRAALVMRELSGLSHEEIGAALGVGVAGAKHAVFDARMTLQEFAKGRGMDCAEVQRRISDGDGRALRGRQLRAHLRACAACGTMRNAIRARSADLHALAPPLPAAAAAGLLAQILGAAGQGGGGGLGAVATAAGKVTAGTLAAKGAAGLAAATVGFGVADVATPERDRARPPAPLVQQAGSSATAPAPAPAPAVAPARPAAGRQAGPAATPGRPARRAQDEDRRRAGRKDVSQRRPAAASGRPASRPAGAFRHAGRAAAPGRSRAPGLAGARRPVTPPRARGPERAGSPAPAAPAAGSGGSAGAGRPPAPPAASRRAAAPAPGGARPPGPAAPGGGRRAKSAG